MKEQLHTAHCAACEGLVKPLSTDAIKNLLTQIPIWEVKNTLLQRRFTFKNFYHTMAFVNAIAWMAHQENHHPDMEVGYNYCVVKYQTHAVRGLTLNDFICAAKVDLLYPT